MISLGTISLIRHVILHLITETIFIEIYPYLNGTKDCGSFKCQYSFVKIFLENRKELLKTHRVSERSNEIGPRDP